MRKTFEELIQATTQVTYQDSSDTTNNAMDIEDVLDLLNLVRTSTLQEAFNNAKVINEYYGNTGSEFCDTVVDPKSILNLPKDSIEL